MLPVQKIIQAVSSLCIRQRRVNFSLICNPQKRFQPGIGIALLNELIPICNSMVIQHYETKLHLLHIEYLKENVKSSI